MPLHPSSVKSSAPRRALKRSAGRTDQRRSTCPRTVTPAVALTALAALANEYLSPALGPRTTEDPIPLVDHRRPARQFLDKRREASDTTSSSRDHAAPRKLGPLIRAFFLLWRARRCNRAQLSWPRSVPNSGCHPRSAPELRGLGQPLTWAARLAVQQTCPTSDERYGLTKYPCSRRVGMPSRLVKPGVNVYLARFMLMVRAKNEGRRR